jgi:hypothetical protein
MVQCAFDVSIENGRMIKNNDFSCPEESNDASNEKIQMPEEVSAGFLFFIGTGLLLLTVVNNLLFHYFIELPEREAQENMEKQQLSVKKALDVNPTLAPQPQ